MGTLSFSSAIANLLVFINAHLAANYTNKVAVIASHCDKAQWLYPSPTDQKLPDSNPSHPSQKHQPDQPHHEPAKRLKLNLKPPLSTSSCNTTTTTTTSDEGNKYRPFRLVEEELLRLIQHIDHDRRRPHPRPKPHQPRIHPPRRISHRSHNHHRRRHGHDQHRLRDHRSRLQHPAIPDSPDLRLTLDRPCAPVHPHHERHFRVPASVHTH